MWYPIADHHDVIQRHAARTSLHGKELVVWRADDGNINVWENRCLHRGVRLSLGVNDGAELVCRYHAWRYANRSGGCTYIPAHPHDAPARTAACSTVPAAERHGLVWSTLAGGDAGAEPPSIEQLGDDAFVLRARPVRAPATVVLGLLEELDWEPFGGDDTADALVERMRVPGGVAAVASKRGVKEHIVFFVQPVNSSRCVVRPVRSGEPTDPVAALRHHATILADVVERAERIQSARPVAPTAETPVAIPTAPLRREKLRVRIERKWATAEGIAAFDLVDAEGANLPTFLPGDHIDLHLPNGLTRQYSITNGPGETAYYRIGVKRDPASTGGSAYLHDRAKPGDVLEISAPRNRFTLRRNVPSTILIAGGIGITPILAMAQALDRAGLKVAVHSFVSSEGEVAFRGVLDRLGPLVHRYVGLDPDATAGAIEQLLATPDPSIQVAACGPPPMLDVIQTIANAAGWDEDAVSFEYFQSGEIDRSTTFTVELARSARTVEVTAGVSVLDAIRAEGLNIDSSCERGACGTCALPVLDGEVDHQDVFLSPAERATGATILTCVSRAASTRLVLDL